MKISTFIFFLLFLFVFVSCTHTRPITESYIKNNIEQHNPHEFSTIRTYTIYQGLSSGSSSYIEFIGYKYRGDKALVIGADQYYRERQTYKGDPTLFVKVNYIHLNQDQVKAILENYQVLQEKIKKEKPKRNEEVYHDYTVSEKLFVSYRKASSSNTALIDFWINGSKYSLSTSAIISKLEDFTAY